MEQKCSCKKCECKSCDCDIIHKELVDKAQASVLDDETLMCIADFYKALSDSTRLKIINLLDKNELCVCDISVLLNMTKSAVSHQLKNLREMNLIKSRRSGKEIFYSLADAHVTRVFEVSVEHVMENKDE